MVTLRAVCVFCGSSTPPDERYRTAASDLGQLLAQRGIELVYGGGSVGLMGEIADATIAAGGRVTGVIPVGLFSREIAHRGLTQLHEVATMHARKELMYDLADAFVALPGGLGTLEELAEVVTWSQLGLHRKPAVLLDVAGFWAPLAEQLDLMLSHGLLKPENRALLPLARSSEEALGVLTASEPGAAERWIGADER
ncbi:MAG: TIGR00730 family Rossman fold protein [Acidobacteria bacterium]|nr:TIGR00730 family Rossman fold protein [Acidobacteriota bacterium]